MKFKGLLTTALLTLTLAACGAEEATTNTAEETTVANTESSTSTEESNVQTITYLGEDYEVPAKVDTIITASLEAMEDAAILGVDPAGVISTDGSSIPSYLAENLAGATVVGSKKEPSSEAMLALNPDVILGTSKWDEAQMATYNKIAATFPYSHVSTNWRENLLLFGQLAGKETEAEQILTQYDEKLAELKTNIASSDLADKEVLIIRVRGGLAVYPKDIYLNASLYEDFGLKVPAELATAEAQTKITYETLAEWNPDVILLQYAAEENTENTEILNEILENEIFKSTTAAKNGEVYTNIIDPMAQGGTAWSKVNFLDAFIENVVK